MSIKMMVRYSFDICFGPKLYQICKISSEGLFVDAYQKQFNIYCIQFKFHFQYISNTLQIMFWYHAHRLTPIS